MNIFETSLSMIFYSSTRNIEFYYTYSKNILWLFLSNEDILREIKNLELITMDAYSVVNKSK